MRERSLNKWLVGAPPLAYLIVFFAIPTLIMVVASFRYAGDFGGLAPIFDRDENGNTVLNVTWENYQRYRQMPPNRQQFLERRYQRFQGMPPEERQRLRQNYENYRRQDPEQRRDFNRKYKRWKNDKR